MQMKFTAGEFEVEAWSDGHPMWTTIRYGQQELRSIHHNELRDLCYALDRLRTLMRAKMPDHYKHELD